MKKIIISTIFLLSAIISFSQERPYVLGFAGGQQKLHQDTFDTLKVSFSGGAPFATNWSNLTPDNMRVLSGFRQNIIYVENAFDKDLFVSKGYYSDYVELKWEVARYETAITSFRIFRKTYNSTQDSVMVASVSSDTRSWRDDYAESNVIYEYTVVAQGITQFNQKMLNYVDGIGFRVPYGRIYGRVTYKGGTAVEGVRLIAETEDNFAGSSLSLNGTSSFLAITPPLDDPNFKFTNQFTFQGWFKPNSGTTACLVEKQNQYKITYSTGQIIFTAGNASTQTLTLNFTEKVDTFFNISAIRGADDTLRLFVIYDYQTFYSSKVKLTVATPSNNNAIFIGKSATGQYYNGLVDEVRIWYKGLSETLALETSSMYIAGTEDSLTAYYRMNENTGTAFYDLSRKGFSFNEEHGFAYQATWSSDVPFSRQLGVMGLTDKNGNYIISGIPFETDGSIYRIVPMFGTHTFDPTEKLLFIGPGSTSHSNIDFVDIASFTVTGYVYYKDTRFPVSDVYVKIDGTTAVNGEGVPIATNSTGKFSVDVPIGKHFLNFVKQGHGFENDGRFPALGIYTGDRFDFQANYSLQNYILDTTLVKVVGRVVGGPVQAEKPIGMGKSLNNIGFAKIILGTQKEFDLIDGSTTVSQIWDNESYEDNLLKNKGVTNYKIVGSAPKQIEIYPDQTTGEYFAYLIPEKYVVKSVTAGSYTFDASFHTTIDLTNASSTNKTEIDSVVIGESFTGNGLDTIYNYRIDSVNYNYNKNFILRVTPSINVVNENNEPDFWEAEVNAKDGTLVDVVDVTGNPLTFYPIFIQRNEYELKISIFEQYINSDAGATIIDNVPVTDGIVEIQNFLSTNESKFNYQVNKQGVVKYKFNAGLPNITTGGIGDYLKTMAIVAKTGQNNSIITNWYPGGSGLYDWLTPGATFRAYVLGGMPTGNNFVTMGPSKIDMILRDPPGSGSYSYFESGKSVSKTSTFDYSNGNSGSESVTMLLGAKTETFAGIGAGVIIEAEVTNDVAIGVEHEETWLNSNTTTTTVTTTETWSTSAEPDYVGAIGDVFIGHSTNLVYGASTFIDLVPEASSVGCVTGDAITGFDIGPHVGLRVNPEFGTGFIYTQNHIENYLIPNLKMLRDIVLQNNSNYTSVHAIGNPNYGSDNNVATLVVDDNGTNGTGTSYNFVIPASWPVGTEFVDSVKHFNKQIKLWKEALARNEKEKVLADEIPRNHSFDAGVVYENSVSYDTSYVESSTFEWSISPSISGQFGFTLAKFGFQASISESYNHTETKTDGTETVNSVTFGYVLTDTDEGDYFSVDVKKPKMQTGPVFYTKGGQSQCPYEDTVVTKYYIPGTLLSEATMQREKPQISVENPIASGVPEDESAVFNVQLQNISETNDDAWFFLIVDDATNPDGALIQMDGSPIGNGRLIKVVAGQTLNKIITVKKTVPSINDYKDLGLILRSSCQWDVGTFPDVADTVSISAYFQPICSNVNLTDLLDNWVVNADSAATNVLIGINNYNLAHSSFERIAFQYKNSSSSEWISDMIFYKDNADYLLANDPRTDIAGQSSLTYTWDLSQLPDRKYDVRLQTQCSGDIFKNTAVLTGIKDTRRPTVFGTPQPGDGILSQGDDIMLTFNEPIESELILSSNFEITGVLNGTDNNHNSCIYFDGVDDYLSNLEGVDLTDKSFTIEFWARKADDNNSGVIYSQSDIEIGFNSSNQFYAKLGTQTTSTTSIYQVPDDWNHYAVSFDKATNELSIFVNDTIERENVLITSDFEGKGRMYVAKNEFSTDLFNGYIHDLRVWEKKLGSGTVYSQMSKILNGSEVGLSGLWLMNESYGEYTEDFARSHHALLVGAEWRVFPTGFARTFNGSANISIPTDSSVIVTNEMDFTLEFWFKAGTQSNTVMFSNGNGDGTDTSPSIENAWNIGFDAQGYLYFKNNGTKVTVTDKLYTDNSWYHLSLVLNRRGNTNLYINGELKINEQSSYFGGLFATDMSIGARRIYSGSGTTYDQNFNGSIDEFRIWKLAKTAKLIELDKNSKLIGDEVGLVAYYPFDEYDVNLAIVSTLDDKVINEETEKLTGLVATANSGSFDNTNVPNIKDARPVQKIQAFTWVTNTDKIILNLEDDPDLIEKCVLTFTAEKIEDLQENRMASPVIWTAYINKNTVIWSENYKEFENLIYNPLSFTVEIKNIGGIEQNYEITNLPQWLSVDQSMGSLLPVSSKTITFTIDEFTNIGLYEASIFLTSDFGYNEKLNIRLKVNQTPPVWEVNEEDFQYSMGVIAQIKVDGKFSTNTDDRIAAFVNGECRGFANLIYVKETDLFEAYLSIFSNSEIGENLEFQIWNASLGKIHTNVTPSLLFESNTVVGLPEVPQIFETNNSFVAEVPLVSGWKWISFNLNSFDLLDVNTLFSKINAINGDAIKGQSVFDIYNSNFGWLGSLSNSGGFNNKSMYMVKLSQQDTLLYSGAKVDVYTTPINLNQGWNWIGFTPQVNIAVNDAFSNYTPTSGDIIKSQYRFSVYSVSMGWVGSLTFLNPGLGYMYKNLNTVSDNFYYPETGLKSDEYNLEFNELNFDEITFNPDLYEFNLSLIGEIATDKILTENHVIAAFVNDECRGYVSPVNVEGKMLYFLTVYSNTDAENISFKLYNFNDNTISDFNESIAFNANELIGDFSNPYLFTIDEVVANITDNNLFSIKVSPNPTNGEFSIQFKNFNKPVYSNSDVLLQITDITGKILYLSDEISENVNIDFSDKSSGVYIVKVLFNNEIFIEKIVIE